jgi:hypothetical protein
MPVPASANARFSTAPQFPVLLAELSVCHNFLLVPFATKSKHLHLVVGIAAALLVCVLGLATIGAFFSSSAKQVAYDNPF